MDYRNDDDRKYYYTPEESNLRRERTGNRRAGSGDRVRKRLKKKARRQKRNSFLRGFTVAVLIVAMLCIMVGTGVGVGMYTAVSTEINDMNLSDLALNKFSYVMYTDENGRETELEKIRSSVNREWKPSEEISQYLKDAAVAIEDERFYKHNGIDIKRTVGATVKYILAKIGIGDSSYGGSTITQQVIKNITNETDKSATRKVKEMMRAIALEKQLEKDEILTMYLNIMYLANNCYGVEAASKMYFGKSASDVNIQEAATIVGITQYPSRYDPYANPESSKEKRNTVLAKMLEHEMITQEEYEKAVESPLKLAGKSAYRNTSVSSYFVDQVISDVMADLQSKMGYSEEFAEQQITNGGLRIYSTIDLEIQEAMESVFENASNFPSSSAESAMVIIDPYTGEIKGMVGGLGKKTDIRGFNRATQAKRQPGSAIKPLAVYAPAIDTGEATQATVVKDEKITIGSDKWEPSNAYKGFKGYMSLHEAVGRSSNIPAVKVLDMVGINKSYSYLENNFKMSTLVSADKNYSSLSLGGLTKGVTVKEMAAAYATFVNSGKYIKPHTYTKVVDVSGNVILENKAASSQAIKATTAYIMADLLSEPVNGSYGTARSAKLANMPTYGKTGTTNDNYDKWFVGFTPYYVGAVWYGYDTPRSVGGSNPSTAVWKKVMQKIHENLDEKEIEKPSGIVEAKICINSGNLSKKSCTSKIAYFASGTQPKKVCSKHYYDDSEPTEAPEESEEPTGSAKPEESAEPTDSPQATSTPKATVKPVSTPVPEANRPEGSATSVPSKAE